MENRDSGRGHSSPIVWGNRLFVTTAVEGAVIPGAVAAKHVINNQVLKFQDTVGVNPSTPPPRSPAAGSSSAASAICTASAS